MRAAESGRDISKKVTESDLGGAVAAGLSSVSQRVRSTVADPELVTKVQAGATSLWSSSLTTASSFWSATKALAADVLTDTPPAGGSGTGGVGGGVSQVPRGGAAASAPSPSTIARAPAPAPVAPVLDDESWLAEQVAQLQPRRDDKPFYSEDEGDEADDSGAKAAPAAPPPAAAAAAAAAADDEPAAAKRPLAGAAGSMPTSSAVASDEDFFSSWGV